MKKGFTLVELLVVIIILGLLGLVVYPSIIRIINDSRKSAYDAQVKIVIKAAKQWGVEHSSELPDSGSTKCLRIKEDLVNGGYISNDEVKNPQDNKTLSGAIEISYSSNQYVYEYKEELRCQ